jgi:nitric oxide reductase NorD protein
LSEYEQAFGFLCDSIVGRHVTVEIDPAAKAVAWTNGISIRIDGKSNEDLNLAVMIQAVLMRGESLDVKIVQRLIGRPTVARRYLAVEVPRAVRSMAARLPRRLLNHPAMHKLDLVPASPADSLAIATSDAELSEPDALFGILRPGQLVRNADAASAAKAKAGETPGRMPARQENVLDDDQEAQESKILKLFSGMAQGGGMLGELLKSLIGMGMQKSSDSTDSKGAGEDMLDSVAGKVAHASALLSLQVKRPDTAQVDLEHASQVFRYPEWDEYQQAYKPDWTTVEEQIPWNPEEMIDVSGAIVPPDREMRQQLGRLGFGFELYHHQMAGDEIVTDDLIRLLLDNAAGQSSDPRIYRGSLKTRRELGVLILLDTSSSVRDVASNGQSIQQQQINLAYKIARTLEEVGDRVALYGFNSWGRARVKFLRVKGFDERLGGTTLERLKHLTPAGFTRIGAAVRHAGRVIRQHSGMPYRLVILITDGLSYDDGYESRYGEADTRHSIMELRAQNTACLCISVASDTAADKLLRVFGETAYIRVESEDQVPTQIGKLFSRALNGIMSRRSRPA